MGILENNGWISPGEAWKIALDMVNYNSTVIVTDQIMYAIPAAMQMYNSGDSIGARITFENAYTRLLEKARANGESPQWYPVLGQDPIQRKSAILAGIKQGRYNWRMNR